MITPLPADRLECLLHALPELAELVDKYGLPAQHLLKSLLRGVGLDDERSGLNELELWARILGDVRGVSDPASRDAANRALKLRGIPEANRGLALKIMSDSVPAQMSQTVPIRASRDVIAFGDLDAGQAAEAILVVTGGPGRAKVGSDTLSVTPATFGPEETQLEFPSTVGPMDKSYGTH